MTAEPTPTLRHQAKSIVRPLDYAAVERVANRDLILLAQHLDKPLELAREVWQECRRWADRKKRWDVAGEESLG